MMLMETTAIEINHLHKAYGAKIAVRDLSLQVLPGEVFGFLGPNGAGKTTSIKMLLGLVHPTAGDAAILGRPISDPFVRQGVGFLPEHFRFHDWLTGEEFLTLHGQLYGMPRPLIKQRTDALLERVGLHPHRKQQLRTYSKGMLQRVGLAQALLNNPRLVFLDEPTSGLDPVGRRLVRDIIREVSLEGTTVFLNSHLLSEVEITCHRVAFIKNGEVVQTTGLSALIDGETTLTIRTGPISPETVAGLGRFGRNLRVEGVITRLTISNEDCLPEITRYLVAEGVDVYALNPERLSLEDMFIKIVGTDGGL